VNGWVVGGLFERHEQAEHAINELVRGGVPRERISVVARDEVYEQAIPGGVGPHGEKLPADEAARIAGLDRATEPGMGSLLAVGPLGALLSGSARSAAGPLAEALSRLGVAPADARRCADRVRRGAVLVVAEAAPTHAEETKHTFRQAGADGVFDGALPP
jgi:hypothetical protein